MASVCPTDAGVWHPKCNYTGPYRNYPVDKINVWGNGECSEVDLWASFGRTIPRWESELRADCCSGGFLIAADGIPRTVALCIIWFLILCWIFLGVAMGADVFMTAIEVITSKETSKKTLDKHGKESKVHARVWNATVANLTLMALGSSAPEILLNVIEVLGLGFNSGDLGPSTIVGSAAFNLMVITAVCIVCLPDGEKRTLKQLGVFLCTAFFSVLAYIWLYLIVVVITPEVIDVWEAAMTVVFMIMLIIFAFWADKHWDKISSISRIQGHSVTGSGLSKKDAALALKEAHVDGKNATTDEIKAALEEQMPPKTRAHYRRQALQSTVGQTATTTKKAGVQVAPSMMEVEGEGKKTRTVEEKTAEYANAPSAGIIKWVQHMYDVMESGQHITIEVERVGGTSGAVSCSYTTKNQTAVSGKDYKEMKGELQWADGEGASEKKTLTIDIYDDDEFEKDEEFTVVLSDIVGGAKFDKDTDGGEEEDVCTINILNDDDRASKLVDAIRLLRLDADALNLAGDDWMGQVRDAFIPEQKDPKSIVMHVLTIPWKLMFAIVPPAGMCGGWPCFFLSLLGIGFQVILISDFATQMGCLMYIKPSVTAITFVALGTSLPDTFASMQAARGDKYADNSVGNVTGSNSVNVFFGLGLPWLIGSVYWAAAGGNSDWRKRFGPGGEAELPADLYDKYKDNGAFIVRKGDLGFSVIVFTIFAIFTIGMILIRRRMGGCELGGNKIGAFACAGILVVLWVLYVLLSTLTTYHIIEPGI